MLRLYVSIQCLITRKSSRLGLNFNRGGVPLLQSTIVERRELVSGTRKVLTQLVGIIAEHFGGRGVVSTVCSMRGYSDKRMADLLMTKGIVQMPSLSDIQILAKARGLNLTPQMLRATGLIGENGDYWLQDRFAIPLRTYGGDVIALVCWYPDKRKYITTRTLGFSSTTTFFNQESYTKSKLNNSDKTVAFVVEGIFDALSVESLGYCCFGNEGLALSPVKKEMLSRFDEVFFIPDNDNPGRKSNKFLCRQSSHLWDTPNGKIIQLRGTKVKDMDDYVKLYAPETLDAWITTNQFLRIDLD